MSPRARSMAPAERRQALIDTTLLLVREHGRAVTTRQIAERAGVAEGTIFRVFDSKEQLVEAALTRAFEPGDLLVRVAAVDRELPLRDRLVAVAAILQQRFRATFSLMERVGLVGPPRDKHDSPAADDVRARLAEAIVEVIGPDADHLAAPVDHVVHVLRLLTFAGSHELIADHRLLTPEQIVDTVLHGLSEGS